MSSYWYILICPAAAGAWNVWCCYASVTGHFPYNRWPARRWLVGPVRR